MNNPNQEIINRNPALVKDEYVQKIHHTNPMGRSNDVQSIVPHYNNGRIDYWDGYYLWDVKADGGNQWYHFKTRDFAQIKPFDESNPIAISNVAIPDKWYGLDVDQVEVDFNTNKAPLSWSFVATGSVIKNNSRKDGQTWFTVDWWGNKINPDAKIACFSTFYYGDTTHLAYSNNDEQFHPINNYAEIDSTMINRNLGVDFRDPYLTTNKEKDKLICYEAGGLASRIYTLTSVDGINWQHDSSDDIDINVVNNPNFKDRMIETPFVTTISGQPIMFFGIQNRDGQPHSRSVSHVGWIAGRFNDKDIFTFDENSRYGFVDDGFDNYAGNFTKLDNDHLVYVGWNGNWGYFNGIHAGSLTLSRIITWSPDTGIHSEIIEPGALTNKSDFLLFPKNSTNFSVGQKIDINFGSQMPNINLTLSRTDNENNKINLKLENGMFTTERLGSLNGATDLTDSYPLPGKNTISTMQIYLDNISVEVYLPEVKKVYTFSTFSGKDAPYKLYTENSIVGTSYVIDPNQPAPLNQTIENAR